MFIQWLNAVRKEFKTLMTGSLLLTVMGLAQGLWQVPIPRWCYSVVVIAFLTWAFYQAWLKERHIRQENINALEHRLQVAEAAATHLQRKFEQGRVAEWKALAEQFQSVSRYFRADWQHGGMGIANGEVIETWHITGLADAPERKQCEALCAFAGALLIQSKMSAQLTSRTLMQKDAIKRWLYFLKETHNAMSMNSGYGMVLESEGEDKIILLGTINDLGKASASACLTCATAEL